MTGSAWASAAQRCRAPGSRAVQPPWPVGRFILEAAHRRPVPVPGPPRPGRRRSPAAGRRTVGRWLRPAGRARRGSPTPRGRIRRGGLGGRLRAGPATRARRDPGLATQALATQARHEARRSVAGRSAAGRRARRSRRNRVGAQARLRRRAAARRGHVGSGPSVIGAHVRPPGRCGGARSTLRRLRPETGRSACPIELPVLAAAARRAPGHDRPERAASGSRPAGSACRRRPAPPPPRARRRCPIDPGGRGVLPVPGRALLVEIRHTISTHVHRPAAVITPPSPPGTWNALPSARMNRRTQDSPRRRAARPPRRTRTPPTRSATRRPTGVLHPAGDDLS